MNEQEFNNKIRRAASVMALHARNITGGHCRVSGLDYDAEISTESLNLLAEAVDKYDAIICEYAKERIGK